MVRISHPATLGWIIGFFIVGDLLLSGIYGLKFLLRTVIGLAMTVVLVFLDNKMIMMRERCSH